MDRMKWKTKSITLIFLLNGSRVELTKDTERGTANQKRGVETLSLMFRQWSLCLKCHPYTLINKGVKADHIHHNLNPLYLSSGQTKAAIGIPNIWRKNNIFQYSHSSDLYNKHYLIWRIVEWCFKWSWVLIHYGNKQGFELAKELQEAPRGNKSTPDWVNAAWIVDLSCIVSTGWWLYKPFRGLLVFLSDPLMIPKATDVDVIRSLCSCLRFTIL